LAWADDVNDARTGGEPPPRYSEDVARTFDCPAYLSFAFGARLTASLASAWRSAVAEGESALEGEGVLKDVLEGVLEGVAEGVAEGALEDAPDGALKGVAEDALKGVAKGVAENVVEDEAESESGSISRELVALVWGS
jgi:hypothetical protein